MNGFDWTSYVNDLYDQAVRDAGKSGVKRGEVITNLVPIIAKALKDNHVDLPDVETMILDTLARTDTQRNRKHRFADLVNLIFAENTEDETILDVDFDPWMQQAWALGGGLRKSGKYLTVEDLDAIISNKRRHATAAVAAYEVEAEAVDRIKAFMRAGNHEMLGDLKP